MIPRSLTGFCDWWIWPNISGANILRVRRLARRISVVIDGCLSLISGERSTLRNQPELPGAGDGFCAVGGAELGQQVRDVLLDRVQGDVELTGDALVRDAGRQQGEHLELARGERIW